jgi:succinate-semialdehyde dehydrogenase/glutarate-semialdehyde dehydrogenase
LKVGHGLDEGVDIGAIVNKEALDNALTNIENAKQAGGRVVAGGNVLENANGYFLEPTVLADVPETATCMREETFAPIAPVVAFALQRRSRPGPWGSTTPYQLRAFHHLAA